MRRLVAWTALAYVIVFMLTVTAQIPSGANAFDGRQTFRYDTFGDEQLWTDTLQMHQALATVTPAMALGVGLKVDVDALPLAVRRALRSGAVDLNDPDVTIQLLSLNAVVGVVGRVDQSGTLQSVGITCALCHSTVDDSLADGIGRRLDGWPNRDLDVGAIVSLSPVVTPAERAILLDWGPGRYDPRLRAFDGTGFISLNPDSEPVVIPPAYGLRGVIHETFTGDGPISYWNAYVGITQMGGQGTFIDPRLGLNIVQTPDLVTPKLPELLEYQLSLRAPAPPKHSFNRGAANRGERLFNGVARCSQCHTPPDFTDVNNGPNPLVPLLHSPAETGVDPTYALRTINKNYRSTPLRGIWQRPPYFHDGSAPDLLAVVEHYNAVLGLGLSAKEKADLVEYLKSL